MVRSRQCLALCALCSTLALPAAALADTADAMALEAAAKAVGTTAIVDSGVSSGMSNLLVGYADVQLDQAENAVIYVGGLPKERTWPYQYKAPFAKAFRHAARTRSRAAIWRIRSIEGRRWPQGLAGTVNRAPIMNPKAWAARSLRGPVPRSPTSARPAPTGRMMCFHVPEPGREASSR